MKDGFRQSMAWLHTWSGLLVCWVLLLVFMAGTSSYYRDEITFWMKPELHAAAASNGSSADAAGRAAQILQQRAPEAIRWTINLPDDRYPLMTMTWANPPVKGESRQQSRARFQRQTLTVDPATGQEAAKPRETRGGEFLYRLHYDLHYMPALWARWIVGFCAMFMLVAIVSGVITHKRIFVDLFTFRPKKGQRSWLDAHNVLAVLPLPFHLMITYTGLVTLMFMLMPAPGKLMYQGDEKTLNAEMFPNDLPRNKPAGVALPMTDLAPVIERAGREWGGSLQPARIIVNNPGDANASIMVVSRPGSQLSNYEPALVFDARGALVSGSREVSAAFDMSRSFYGLHLAHFAGPLLRALFFFCGLAGCAMVATGALLWAVKERQKYAKAIARGGRAGFGVRLVDGLNIGAIAGLPIAFGAYFWGNRLLPVALDDRIAAEAACFFAAWGAAAVLAQVSPTRRMWQIQLWSGAFLFAAMPLLNGLTGHGSHLGVTLFGNNRLQAIAGFDLVTMTLGLLLGYAAVVLGRRNSLAARARLDKPSPGPARAGETGRAEAA